MKIAIVNRHVDDNLGGSEMQCNNIATGLQAKGHQVTYIAPMGDKKKKYSRPYRVVAVDSSAAAIADAVLAEKPDAVYWRFNKFHFYGAAKKIAGENIPIVFSISHINDTKLWNSRVNPLKSPRLFLRFVKQGLESVYNHQGYRYVKGIASLSRNFLNIVDVEQQRYLPNSVDVTAVPFTWPKPFVIWVANLKPAKQPEMFVQLAKDLQSHNIDFLMVGKIQSGDYRWIENEDERTPNFRYLGQKTPEEVNGILNESLFNVHTCQPEGFGNIFIQAWLQRKPTISLAFDPDDLISAQKLGGYAKGDYNQFKAQVESLLQDAELRRQTGERAYTFANQNFSITRTVNEIEAFLIDVASEDQNDAALSKLPE